MDPHLHTHTREPGTGGEGQPELSMTAILIFCLL
jgi:hypothetical protein